MAYCKNCGQEIQDGASFCTNCGQQVNESNNTCTKTNNGDSVSSGFCVLSFFIPLAGLILYLCWHDEKPLRAKSCGKWALIGFIVSIIFSIIYYIFFLQFIVEIVGSFYK